MNEIEKKLSTCEEYVRSKVDFEPRVGLVLGSGLGEYAHKIEVLHEIPYSEIPGFPVSTVAGHNGKFLFGMLGEIPVVLMQGRVHLYEGYDITDVVLPVRLMAKLGAKTVLLTNAAGGINLDFKPGDLMMLTDHISNLVKSSLVGPNCDSLGVRFPDMSNVYDKELQELIRTKAKECGFDLKEGVYIQTTGPNYETPAEIRMFRAWGADAVGMSTACEAMALRHMGVCVGAISCISNMAAGILDQPLNHDEVQATAKKVKDTFERLVTEILSAL